MSLQRAVLGVNGINALQFAARFWFITALIGQWIFVAYLVLLYGGSAVRGELEVWGTKLTHGYVPGDVIGNLAVAAHLLLAGIFGAFMGLWLPNL